MAELWRHKKRGMVYEVIDNRASIQCATDPYVENNFGNYDWTVYRNVDTGAVWVRLTKEFQDGRFERVAAVVGGEQER